jgi:hypothetical protein
MLLELPFDVQQAVLKHLHVKDRAKLTMALPKDLRTRIGGCKNSATERRLGLLSKAVAKKHVRKLTPAIERFLKLHCEGSDPTIKEMARAIPEVEQVMANTLLGDPLAQKIHDGTVTEADIEAWDGEDQSVCVLAECYGCSVQTFELLWANNKMRAIMESRNMCYNSYLFLFQLFNYARDGALVEHILANPERYGMNAAQEKQGVLDCLMRSGGHVSHWHQRPEVRAMILRHLPLDKSHLEHFMNECISEMVMDAYEDYWNAWNAWNQQN